MAAMQLAAVPASSSQAYDVQVTTNVGVSQAGSSQAGTSQAAPGVADAAKPKTKAKPRRKKAEVDIRYLMRTETVDPATIHQYPWIWDEPSGSWIRVKSLPVIGENGRSLMMHISPQPTSHMVMPTIPAPGIPPGLMSHNTANQAGPSPASSSGIPMSHVINSLMSLQGQQVSHFNAPPLNSCNPTHQHNGTHHIGAQGGQSLPNAFPINRSYGSSPQSPAQDQSYMFPETHGQYQPHPAAGPSNQSYNNPQQFNPQSNSQNHPYMSPHINGTYQPNPAAGPSNQLYGNPEFSSQNHPYMSPSVSPSNHSYCGSQQFNSQFTGQSHAHQSLQTNAGYLPSTSTGMYDNGPGYSNNTAYQAPIHHHPVLESLPYFNGQQQGPYNHNIQFQGMNYQNQMPINCGPPQHPTAYLEPAFQSKAAGKRPMPNQGGPTQHAQGPMMGASASNPISLDDCSFEPIDPTLCMSGALFPPATLDHFPDVVQTTAPILATAGAGMVLGGSGAAAAAAIELKVTPPSEASDSPMPDAEEEEVAVPEVVPASADTVQLENFDDLLDGMDLGPLTLPTGGHLDSGLTYEAGTDALPAQFGLPDDDMLAEFSARFAEHNVPSLETEAAAGYVTADDLYLDSLGLGTHDFSWINFTTSELEQYNGLSEADQQAVFTNLLQNHNADM